MGELPSVAEPLAGRHAASGGPALFKNRATRLYRGAGEQK